MKWVETEGYGLYRNHPRRKEKVVRVTKTLVVTEFARYNRKTGVNIDLSNKSVGGYRLSAESIQLCCKF